MDDILDRLGLLVDRSENFLSLVDNPFMSDYMKLDALKHGMKELRDYVKQIYFDAGGEDVWDEEE